MTAYQNLSHGNLPICEPYVLQIDILRYLVPTDKPVKTVLVTDCSVLAQANPADSHRVHICTGINCPSGETPVTASCGSEVLVCHTMHWMPE